MSPLLLQINDTSDTWLWWLLLSLGAFLLGSLLTWLFTRVAAERLEQSNAERDRYHASATKWEKDYQGVKYQLEEAHKMEADLRASLQSCEADRQMLRYRAEKAEASLTEHATEQAGGFFEDDNLRIISGIGPVANAILRDAGITSWRELAAAEVTTLGDILRTADHPFDPAELDSWPKQATLAAAGRWEELRVFQCRLRDER
ncbi:putative flap endonuclease-1-like 5' DNA nuclease [Lewinella aquimaris]|uniref:Putative flap endonuclease-1-like 5' DNA nuclease n=1 Tax=Neolewinella aquimaris TaxID=1835722 RepID=A0A840EGH9_9BACT|nr:hypothetical protein [Neolewinella aquimaris]MBB4080998.1 putative flap endonuclease-1-like 5' DNA nuclease [Neolewinella aquimaris]